MAAAGEYVEHRGPAVWNHSWCDSSVFATEEDADRVATVFEICPRRAQAGQVERLGGDIRAGSARPMPSKAPVHTATTSTFARRWSSRGILVRSGHREAG
jgi:hypothetical protein